MDRRGLSDSSVTESLGFSPSRAVAVDFGDFQVVQEFVDHEFAPESTDRKSPGTVLIGEAEGSDWIYKTKQLFLRLPA